MAKTRIPFLCVFACQLPQRRARHPQQEAKGRRDVADLNRDAPELPAETFEENLFVLNDGRRKEEFRFFGQGHTRGDGWVYLPKEQVLCTGNRRGGSPRR